MNVFMKRKIGGCSFCIIEKSDGLLGGHRNFTLGVHPTQRAEAVHSAIKHFLTAHTLLIDLAKKLEEYRLNIAEKGEGVSTRLLLRQATESVICHPIEQQFENGIRPFALKLLKSQITRCLNYTIIYDNKCPESSLQEHTSEEGNIYTI